MCRLNLVATVLMVSVLASCGNLVGDIPDPIGAIGISVDKAGDPVAVLAVCSGKVTQVDIVGPLVDEENPNEEIGLWKSVEPITSDTTLNFLRPGAAWTGLRQPKSFKPGLLHLVGDRTPGSDDQGSLGDAAFTSDQLTTLDPSKVLLSDGGDFNEVVDRDTFHARTCDKANPVR